MPVPHTPKVLLVYKKSNYQIYVKEKRVDFFRSAARSPRARWVRDLRRAHRVHAKTLQAVEAALERHGFEYKAVYRARSIDYRPYGLIVSVGGDGTFLEAARRTTRQPVLGVNSNPRDSVGIFCRTDLKNIDRMIRRLKAQKAKVRPLMRLELRVNGRKLAVRVLNDLLICHANPSSMSRYGLRLGRLAEEQRSSGLWVATPAGSTGASLSAGGRRVPLGAPYFQYVPRELYRGHGVRYRLTKGLVPKRMCLSVRSLMREGMLYVDGAHWKHPFRYGDVLTVSEAPQALRLVE